LTSTSLPEANPQTLSSLLHIDYRRNISSCSK
jgi:hypothetical protein